jgi:hypothetical protein
MDVRDAVMGGNWPAVVVPDPYFPYVTMLLPGNGTNGAQNNTFLDSSASPLTITRNGNTTQGTFSPYGSNWSNYFDGSGDYLDAPSSSAFTLGTGDFTIEMWYNPSVSYASGNVYLFDMGTNGTRIQLFSNTVYFLPQSGNSIQTAAGVGMVVGTWYHVAAVRSGSTMTLYVNGSSVGTTTNSSNLTNTLFRIGDYGGGGYGFNGYISNVRVVKGTAVYTSSFTPSTTPLTAISGTSLLTCQSNRFIDNSTNNFTVTVAGNTSVQRFSPFSPTAAYSTSVIGGSGYFDGSGDNLVTSGAGSFNPRSTFTVEFWTYPITNNTVTWINSNTNDNFYIETFSGTLYVGDGSINTISTTPPALNRWTHVLLSFDGTTYRLFYNGVSQATSTTLLASTTLTAFRVGQKNDTSRPFSGFISDMRVLVGTALYTSAFTPPTAPLAAISNTILLLSYTNAGIIDNAMMNNLETVGNVQISTSVSKFGGGSIAFDGAGDILKITPDVNVNMNFDTGPFTFECWVYRSSASGQIFIADFGVTSVNGWALYDEGATGNMQVRIADVDRIAVSPIPATTWTHLAVVRVGTTITLYVNGTSAGSYASAGTNFIYAGTKYIGSQSGSSSYMNGYMDDIRITKGLARYTANFTAPTEAFPTL